MCVCVCVCAYIYIYIYIYRGGERVKLGFGRVHYSTVYNLRLRIHLMSAVTREYFSSRKIRMFEISQYPTSG